MPTCPAYYTIGFPISASGTMCSGTLISGSKTLNETVNYFYSLPCTYFPIEVISGSQAEVSQACWLSPLADVPIYLSQAGDASVISPEDQGYGLLAWHCLQEQGSTFSDSAGHEKTAYATGSMAHVVGKYGPALSLDEYPYNHVETAGLDQQTDYMCSFWFKPTKLLTSGTSDCFTVFDARPFSGDHFRDSWDYNVFSPYKGWKVLNGPTTCSAGYLEDYLRLQGPGMSDWFGPTWTAGTLYFDIDKAWDWDVQIRFRSLSDIAYGQTVGFIFFNKSSYLNYCSMVMSADSLQEGHTAEGSIPYMTSANTPSGYVVTQSSYYTNSPTYLGWHAFQDPALAGTNYFHSGDGSLPDWVSIDLGAGTNKIIQGYRIRHYGPGGHYPRDWQFQGSLGGSAWDTLHTMVGQPALVAGTWTSWFYFTNSTRYRYYRIYVTRSATGTSWCSWQGTQFIVQQCDPSVLDASIKVRTASLSYTIEEHASISGTWLFEMQKRDQYVWFNYRREDAPGWSSPIYRMDTSSWATNMGLGVQSCNAIGVAPDVVFDYFKFKRGQKPLGMGDAEPEGKLSVTYNMVDAGTNIEERTDSRIWLNVGSGMSYGTASYYWDPDQWYLLQFGVKAGANPLNVNTDYCWWVNATQEQGLLVGSGTGPAVIVPSGIPFSYFDPEPYTSLSGSFKLDEVSHWSRWLTGEEILRIWMRLSQMSWHKTEPYIQSSEHPLVINPTQSGIYGLYEVTPQHKFEWSTQYQFPPLPQQTVSYNKVSYRIQQDMKLFATRLDTVQVNIRRQSSGWMIGSESCYCAYITSLTSSGTLIPNPNYPFTVQGSTALFTLAYNNPVVDVNVRAVYRTFDNAMLLHSIDPQHQLTYRILTLDTTGPMEDLNTSLPRPNERLVHPSFAWYDTPALTTTVEESLSGLSKADTRIWMKRIDQGYYPYMYIDDFSFYEHDFKSSLITPSGIAPSGVVADTHFNMWQGSNIRNATECYVNRGFSSAVELDLSTMTSGLAQVIPASGIDQSLETLRRMSQHYNPDMTVFGSDALVISTSGGSWVTRSGTQNAPFLFWTVPSGLYPWEIKTKVKVDRFGDERGLAAGLMICDVNRRDYAYQLLASISGVMCRSPFAQCEYAPAASGLVSPDSEVWLSISGTQDNIHFRWSNDGLVWNIIDPHSDYYILTRPAVSGTADSTQWNNTMVSGYPCRTNHYDAVYPPWKLFTRTNNNADDCWKYTGPVDNIYNPVYIDVDLGVAQIVRRYRLLSRYVGDMSLASSAYTRMFPRGFELLGSNNTSTWVPLDSQLHNRTDLGSNSYGPIYNITSPAAYRYYRLLITYPYSDLWYVPTDAIGVALGELELYGLMSTQPTMSGVTWAAGPLVLAEHIQELSQDSYSASNVVPYMSTSTVPSGYIITGNATKPFYPFVGGEGDMFAIEGYNTDWVGIEFTTPDSFYIIDSYRFRCLDTRSLCEWYMAGTLDRKQYDNIAYVTNYPRLSSDQWSPWLSCNEFHRPYVEYRFLFSDAYDVDWHNRSFLNGLELRGYKQIDWITTSGDILTSAYFDFLSFSSSSGVSFLRSQDNINMWEPLLIGTTAMNSSFNSGITTYTEDLDTSQTIEYETKTDFRSHEPVYVRKQFSDKATHFVDYTVDINTLLLLSAEATINSEIKAGMASQSGVSNYFWDQSPYQHIVTSDPLVTISNDEVFLGQGSFRFTGSNKLIVTDISGTLINDDWVFDCMLHADNITYTSPILNFVDQAGIFRLGFYLRNSDILIRDAGYNEHYLTSLTRTSGWEHIQIAKQDNMFKAFYNDYKLPSNLDFKMPTYYATVGCNDRTYVTLTTSTPKMTSNTTPSPYVVSSNPASTDAWNAFDQSTLGYGAHLTSLSNAWVQIYLGPSGGFIARKWRWRARYDSSATNPKRFSLQGSLDGQQIWVDLHTAYSAVDYPLVPARRTTEWFIFDNSVAYNYYRMCVLAGYSSDVYVGEIEISDDPAIPRWEVSPPTNIPSSTQGEFGLFDDLLSTNYQNVSSPWYIKCYMATSGSPCVLKRYRFRSYNFNAGGQGSFPKNVLLSYSNLDNPYIDRDADWIDLVTLTSPAVTEAYVCNDWTNVPVAYQQPYRFIRLKGVQSQNGTNNIIISAFYPDFGPQPLLLGTTLAPTTSGCNIVIGDGFSGYMDMIRLRSSAPADYLQAGNTQDVVSMFSVVAYESFTASLTILPDTESPVVSPVSPVPEQLDACPASGIVFDILDDYSGVHWDSLKIIVDNMTVFSGGLNMTEFITDRGTLVWEERGQLDGEWYIEAVQGASGIVYNDGINRQLYPPGTVYSGSGAWGRRFTYHLPPAIEMEYFGKRIQITVTGTDNRGYLSKFDVIYPNAFQHEYGFNFIPNTNIQMGNFFMAEGESERIDILQAKDKHLWVDMWDTNYPATDIVEDESYLTFDDGRLNFVCSGTWFTTYTGTEGTASGVLVHRLHYDAGDYYWDGHRTMHWQLHAQNNDPRCHVYNRDEYELLYGWHVFWHHHKRIPAFEFDKKLPVFISIKTQEYVPSRYSTSYMLWTAPPTRHTFGVDIKALPLGSGNELEVDLIAHSQYLQYSEDVDVEFYCKDMDGNELLYTWTFRTEDEPQ